MGLRVLILLLVAAAVQGLMPSALNSPASMIGNSKLGCVAMSAADVVERKSKVVDEVKETMAKSALMFSVSLEGITVNEMNEIRQKYPEDVTIRCTKNTLIRRAAEDYPQFQGGEALQKGSNYWFFVPEDRMRESVKIWEDFVSGGDKEQNAIAGGVFQGEYLDSKGVVSVSKLPTKQELMGQTAGLLMQIPTKLARGIKEAGAVKIARGMQRHADGETKSE